MLNLGYLVIKISNNIPYKAVQAWLITSKHTVPETSSMFG